MQSFFNFFKKRKTRKLNKIIFRQSSLHKVIGPILPTNKELRDEKKSQSRNRSLENTIKIVKTSENKVYWVHNNVFYCVDEKNGDFDPADAKPIDTENLSKEEIDKLLFILDSLKDI